MVVCSYFDANLWRPNKCRNCSHQKEEHLANQTTTTTIEKPSPPKVAPQKPVKLPSTPKTDILPEASQDKSSNITLLADSIKSNQSSTHQNTSSQQQEQQPPTSSTISSASSSDSDPHMSPTNQNISSQQQSSTSSTISNTSELNTSSTRQNISSQEQEQQLPTSSTISSASSSDSDPHMSLTDQNILSQQQSPTSSTVSNTSEPNMSSADQNISSQEQEQEQLPTSSTISSASSSDPDPHMSLTDQNILSQQQSLTSSTTSNTSELNMSPPDRNAISQPIEQQSVSDSNNIISTTPDNEPHSSTQQIPCRFGKKCYRKNPQHLKKYSHRHKTSDIINNPSLYTKLQSVKSCRYGEKCYTKNPEHLKQYSHPHKPLDTIDNQPLDTEPPFAEPPENTDSEKVAELQIELEVQQEIAQIHLELVEKQFLASIAKLQDKNKYLEEEMGKLHEEKTKIAMYHQQLENALAQELNNRERREIEKERILEIRRDTPSYWDINEFIQPYREIEIRPKSPEFNILRELLNETIETHGNNYGTIYGKDPTEFIITKITRIHNKRLWHEYCFKKESIMENNNKRLADCESSKYLKDHPLLTPLLDASANEYWLFHGCSDKIVPTLVYTGYDPRVSSLDGMFGGGFYLAENSSKSNQYIPCPNCGKNSIFSGSGCSCKNQEDLEFSIILYRAVLGDVHIVKQYDKKTYRDDAFRVRRPPPKENSIYLYDSIMGESKKNGGNKLLYREFILYESGQAYPEYVIKFKRSAANARPPSNIQRTKDKYFNLLKNVIPKTHK